MENIFLDFGFANGRTELQEEFYKKVKELVKSYGQLLPSTYSRSANTQVDKYLCPELNIEIVSTRDSS